MDETYTIDIKLNGDVIEGTLTFHTNDTVSYIIDPPIDLTINTRTYLNRIFESMGQICKEHGHLMTKFEVSRNP